MTAAQAAAVSRRVSAGSGGARRDAAAARPPDAARQVAAVAALSATTIGIIGGAAAGGAVVATKVVEARTAPGRTTLLGPFSFDWVGRVPAWSADGDDHRRLIAASDTPETPCRHWKVGLSTIPTRALS